MLKGLVILVLGVALALAPTASAQTKELAALKKQVAALTRQVKTLQTQVKTLQRQSTSLSRGLDANFYGDACLAAITADGLQGTWTVVDQLATAAASRTYFTPAAPVNDEGACADLIPPIVRQTTVPPTTATFQGLINWLI